MSPPRRRAFTLVELLVVISIIIVLIALLFPAVRSAQRQARTVGCLANLRRLGGAFLMYVQQNDGRPPTLYSGDDNHWVPLLERQTPSARRSMYCPQAPEPHSISQHDFGGWCLGTAGHAWAWKVTPVATGVPWAAAGGSYGINDWVLSRSPDQSPLPRAPRDLFHVWPPEQGSSVPLFGDCAYSKALPLDTDLPPLSLRTPLRLRGVLPSGDGNLGMRPFCMSRHGRAINLVFVDGHARTVPLPELWRLKWNRRFEPTDVTLPPE